MPFETWIATFRAKASARGITDETYTRVMHGLKPDMAVLEQSRSQPEFHEQLWQYLNRRVSEWRIIAGKEKAKEFAPLFARIEKDYGVERCGHARRLGRRDRRSAIRSCRRTT